MNPAEHSLSGRGLSRRQWLAVFVICGAVAILAYRYVRIGLNESRSLKAKVFLVIRNGMPSDRGDYVVFRWSGQGGFYRPGALFTKIVVGFPGDSVEVLSDGRVSVSGKLVGYAKPYAKNGVKLEPIDAGVIPAGHFFVAGQSEDSLDSRYKVVGLIQRDRVVGTAHAIY